MVHAFAGADDGEESEGSGIGHEGVHFALGSGFGGWNCCLLEGTLQGPNSFAEGILPPPQILELLLGRSPGDVSGHQIINQAHVFTAAALGFANPLRIGAQDQGVNHGLTVPAPVS